MLCLCERLFICALWSPAGKGLTSWLSFVVSNCEFVTFPSVSWVRQVWYLIVSIPDLCTLTYFFNLHNFITCITLNSVGILRWGFQHFDFPITVILIMKSFKNVSEDSQDL